MNPSLAWLRHHVPPTMKPSDHLMLFEGDEGIIGIIGIIESTGYSPFFLFFVRHSCLPVDLLFGLAEETDLETPKGHVEKWRKRLTAAYRIANNNSLSSSTKGKSYYDQKLRGVALKTGDRALVGNLGKRGEPGKLRSYWEKKINVIKEQVADNTVYIH